MILHRRSKRRALAHSQQHCVLLPKSLGHSEVLLQCVQRRAEAQRVLAPHRRPQRASEGLGPAREDADGYLVAVRALDVAQDGVKVGASEADGGLLEAQQRSRPRG
jgi:hypothetical protein